MILLLGGTTEAREITKELLAQRRSLIVTVATRFGEELLWREFPKSSFNGLLQILRGKLSPEELKKLLGEKRVKLVIDATHPFSTGISDMAYELCTDLALPYLRYLREAAPFLESKLVHYVKDFEEAAEVAGKFGERVFLTTGVKNLSIFQKIALSKGQKVIVRILPRIISIDACLEKGIEPRNILACQGPFTKEFNKACFKEFSASVVVTKESGVAGGFLAKAEAALELKIPLVVIRRPEKKGEVAESLTEILRFCERFVK